MCVFDGVIGRVEVETGESRVESGEKGNVQMAWDGIVVGLYMHCYKSFGISQCIVCCKSIRSHVLAMGSLLAFPAFQTKHVCFIEFLLFRRFS